MNIFPCLLISIIGQISISDPIGIDIKVNNSEILPGYPLEAELSIENSGNLLSLFSKKNDIDVYLTQENSVETICRIPSYSWGSTRDLLLLCVDIEHNEKIKLTLPLTYWCTFLAKAGEYNITIVLKNIQCYSKETKTEFNLTFSKTLPIKIIQENLDGLHTVFENLSKIAYDRAQMLSCYEQNPLQCQYFRACGEIANSRSQYAFDAQMKLLSDVILGENDVLSLIRYLSEECSCKVASGLIKAWEQTFKVKERGDLTTYREIILWVIDKQASCGNPEVEKLVRPFLDSKIPPRDLEQQKGYFMPL